MNIRDLFIKNRNKNKENTTSNERQGINEQEKVPKISVGLDLGTSKVCALVASPSDYSNSLNILGIGIADSEGLNRGVVINIDRTVKAIQKAIEQAEQQSGISISDITIGIAGDHIEAFPNRGIVGISNANSEVTSKDVARVIEECRNIKLSPDRQILHVIPQEYIIDGQDGFIDPIGINGVRLEAIAHIVTGLTTAIKNIYRCIERINESNNRTTKLRIKDIVLEPIASSYAVLDDDEKEVGVALIDIGGGTTDIAIFSENIIRFTSIIGIAGKQVTDDIRRGLGIIATQAERIKREYGHCYLNGIMHDEMFMIPGVGGRKPIDISKSYLCQIIQPRMEELFEFALSEIRRSGFASSLGAGVVITGGCSLLGGVEDLARDVFGMPVKIGIPSGINCTGLVPEIQNPIYSTAVGLAMYDINNNHKNEAMNFEPIIEEFKEEKPNKKRILQTVKIFFQEL